MIAAIMTEKEMATQLAAEIARLRNFVDSIHILMTKYRTVDATGTPIPWRQDLSDLQALEEYRDLVQSRDLELAQLTGGEEFGSPPFRAVWKKYCQPRSQ
jgi:L-rhamnose isomerase